MTLEEIQAIVAAGEGNDGHLVTLSNDDHPSVAFNFSQPPYTKVHSVVTNVQNVLKAQMEAQKNKPPSPASLDTPDVSESWSLILPSIFGNTGVDIVPDKSSSVITTPETETIDIERPINSQILENSLSKEGSHLISNNKITTSTIPDIKVTVTEKSTTTTKTPPSLSTIKQILHRSTTTVKPRTTTIKLQKSTTVAPKITTAKFKQTTKKPQILNIYKNNNSSVQNTYSTIPDLTTDKTSTIKFERVSIVTTPIPNTTKVINENANEIVTSKPNLFSKTTTTTSSTTKSSSTSLGSTESPKTALPPVTTYKPVKFTSFVIPNNDSNDTTTLTTQSVSPSTTVSTTQFMKNENTGILNESLNDKIETNKINNENEYPTIIPDIPIFDVAQSISQIASDLGNNFPNPTTSNLLDTTKLASTLDLESKENVEIDIPIDLKNDSVTETINISKENDDNEQFVKLSTISPTTNPSIPMEVTETSTSVTILINNATVFNEQSNISETTIDPILSESMDDLLSQVVNQVPQTIISTTVINLLDDKFVTNKPNNIVEPIKSVETFQEVNKNSLDNNNQENIAPNKTKDILEEISTSSPMLNNISENYNKADELKDKYVKIPIITDTNKKENSSNYDENVSNKTETNKLTIESNSTKKVNINSTLFTNNDTKLDTVVNVSEKIPIPTNTIQNIKQEFTNKTETKLPMLNVSVTSFDKNKTKTENNKYTNIDSKIPNKENVNTVSELIPKEDIKKKIQKINIDDKELLPNIRNNSWKLISTVSPPNSNDISKEKPVNHINFDNNNHNKEIILDGSKENQGLEVTTKDLAEDIYQFTELCNELAFRYWNTVLDNTDKKRSFIVSPYSITSMLAMMFMGARGATSGEMNDILKLDDMVTFNPHFTLKNISDSIETSSESGVAISAFVRELYSDKEKGKILTFYKERAQHFYNGHVEEVNFKVINDIIRRRTNLLVKRYTWGKIGEYMKSNSISVQPPLAAFSANIFEVIYFVVCYYSKNCFTTVLRSHTLVISI